MNKCHSCKHWSIPDEAFPCNSCSVEDGTPKFELEVKEMLTKPQIKKLANSGTISIQETNKVVEKYFPEFGAISMNSDPSATLLQMVRVLSEKYSKLEIKLVEKNTNNHEIQNLKGALLDQAGSIQNLRVAVTEHKKEISELKQRTINIENWIDEVIKWIDNGIELFTTEISGISALKKFLESWSK